MDPNEKDGINHSGRKEPDEGEHVRRITRREAIKYGLYGVVGCCAAGSLTWQLLNSAGMELPVEVFKNDAPNAELWALWRKRGWAKEGMHYLQLGRNVQCKVCPNECILEPGDRSRCRNKINRDGKLFTLAYGNPCTFHVDPIEKKPLYHFLPETGAFSIATSGCGFRCLNCQNWEISQSKPEETKDPHGESLRFRVEKAASLTFRDVARLSMLPGDVVEAARELKCTSIAYTYSEPTSYYEYMYDTSKLARSKGIKNVWVSCGYIQSEALNDFCAYLDAASVDLKSFSDAIYRKLNSGKLQPILDTFRTLKERSVWFEISNLVVPTYTDDPEMIKRMCGWFLKNLGPDYPLHFLRFHPAHKLAHLPPTPTETLARAREIARQIGLRYVYVGNVPDLPDAGITYCPHCKKAVVTRELFFVRTMNIRNGKCGFCGTKIAGVWPVING